MITKRQLILIITVVVLLLIIGIGVLIYGSIQKNASFTIKEVSDGAEDNSKLVDVDYRGQTDLLTSEQKRQLPDTLLTKTTKEAPKSSDLRATLRDDTVSTVNGETLFIVDVEQLQTSYMISRYVSAEESVDIVNVLCVPADKKIYEPDFCYES